MTQVNHRCAVLGKPIAHSLSPVLHQAAYRALGFDDWAYGRYEIGETDLDGFLHSLDPSWRGLSLTMPLKKTIQAYGTPSNRWAQRLLVANTAIFDWTRTGVDGLPAIDLYNTDVMGIVLALRHAMNPHYVSDGLAYGSTLDKSDISDSEVKRAVVIGNGNTAASAVAAMLTMSGAVQSAQTAQLSQEQDAGQHSITVGARHPGRYPDLASMVKGSTSPNSNIAYHEMPIDDSISAMRNADVVVSTIPGHAADTLAATIAHDDTFTPHGVLLDVVYDPRPTALIRAWRNRGGLAIGGEEMLLYQAILQVWLMTGHTSAASVTSNISTSGTGNANAREATVAVNIDADYPYIDPALEHAMRTALEEAL